eukprot:19709-Heterococcus_DN1.PRE.2
MPPLLSGHGKSARVARMSSCEVHTVSQSMILIEYTYSHLNMYVNFGLLLNMSHTLLSHLAAVLPAAVSTCSKVQQTCNKITKK